MKLLFINTSPFLSGAEISMLQLLEGMDEKSFEVITVLPENASYRNFLPDKVRCITMPLVWFVRSMNPRYIIRCLRSILVVSIRLIRIIRKEKIKLIYANTPRAFIYVYFLKLFVRDRKLVCHVRDEIRSGMLRRMLKRQSDQLICVSDYIYQQLGTNKGKKQLIYSGVGKAYENLRQGNDPALKLQLGLNPHTVLIAQIGQLTRWKNQKDFIRAAGIIKRHCDHVHFLIIGEDISGRETVYKQELNQLTEQLGIADHIRFFGQRDDVSELLQQMDILVHPAIKEPFGRVVIEAMAAGVPVVAYNSGGPREIVLDNETGYLVEPYDHEALAYKTIDLIKNKALRMLLGNAGRKRVIEHYSVRHHVREMETVFQRL